MLELDEVWSFVGSKKNKVWLWLALCRRTRQIVGHPPGGWYGERDAASCAHLWNRIPEAYRQGRCYSDFWEAYQQALPAEQHRACAKSEGETNLIERFNLTLRQSVARLVRKTLSFSKDLLWHLRAIRHALVTYNLRKAKQYRLQLRLQQRSINPR